MGVSGPAESPDEAHRRAVQSVFERHARDVWRSLHFLGVPERDLPDVSQEVFMTVHRRLPSFEGRASLSSWLYGICLRTVAMYRRKAFRRHERPHAEVPADEPVQATPEDAMHTSQRLARLRRAIDELDEGQRAVFVLYEIESLPMPQIAAALAIPLQTAYSRLHAARARVRARFEPEAEGGNR